MTLLQPNEVPSRAGINNVVTSEIAAHASTSNPASQHYDSGWVNVPIATGFQAYPGRTPKVRRIGKQVEFRGSYQATGGGAITGGSGTTHNLGNMPAGFGPADFLGFTVMAGSNATSGSTRGWIDAGGGIRVGPNVATPYVSFAITYFIE